MISMSVDSSSLLSSLDKRVRSVKPRLAEDIFRRLIILTPVKTGRARFSWDITTSSFKAPPPEGIYSAPSIPPIPKTDGPVYIYNPIDYIEALNEGSSRQAPAMFVESAVWAAIFNFSSRASR